jgi:integrase
LCSYLGYGFKLFLLTGARREEVVDLKWSDIFIAKSGVRFFIIGNLKVERQRNKEYLKYIPINKDLRYFLNELGYDEKRIQTSIYCFQIEKS